MIDGENDSRELPSMTLARGLWNALCAKSENRTKALEIHVASRRRHIKIHRKDPGPASQPVLGLKSNHTQGRTGMDTYMLMELMIRPYSAMSYNAVGCG